jgi:hypothetical protein
MYTVRVKREGQYSYQHTLSKIHTKERRKIDTGGKILIEEVIVIKQGGKKEESAEEK